jgi:hypothetical protein
MNYNEAFAIDDISYLARKKEVDFTPTKYQLLNYDYYKPKLVSDFYLKYFTRELLFEIDILEVEEFLQYHYEYCDNPDLYFKVLNFKITPKIDELVENAQASLEVGGYYNQTKLDDGFVESEGVVHNPSYDYPLMLHQINACRLNNDIKKRAEIINEFLKSVQLIDKNLNALVWKGKTAHLAYIISKLVGEGYIEAPVKQNGEINYTELSRQIQKSFNFDSKTPSPDSLRRYSSVDDERYKEIDIKFTLSGFNIPNSKIVG